MTEGEAIQSLAALAQETRLRVFRHLVRAEPAGATPGQLAEALACSTTALSFHLKELHHAGLVACVRSGRHLIYRASVPAMNGLIGYLTDHCCQGQPCLDSAAVDCQVC